MFSNPWVSSKSCCCSLPHYERRPVGAHFRTSDGSSSGARAVFFLIERGSDVSLLRRIISIDGHTLPLPLVMQIPPQDEFQVGWICALPIEAAAAKLMLDERYGLLNDQDPSDTNTYELGRVGIHKVVIACLPIGQYGTTSATLVATNMLRTFSKSLRIGLMVGIGGGIPSLDRDIRLGDIVVSSPEGTCGGVIQHDRGKRQKDGELLRTGCLNSPPRSLLNAVSALRSECIIEESRFPGFIEEAINRNPRTSRNFARPDASSDRLFAAQYDHTLGNDSCDECPTAWEVCREARDPQPVPHYGVIASGNQLIKNGVTRDAIGQDTGALCFEMEAAGLMQDFPCIVIRGICDYSDSHKNKRWQGYAALSAAAYTKELLSFVPRGQISQERLVTEVCGTLPN
ncbi:purine and uridine phosphorylase [Myriangium duriaei CBS 260.36]|uniref:Purine and uridine phosphorylase n=1 Tax=Myriangium duriaei CBS 260.36 TaxID=1168546 RepID=A0A9P4IVG5_9PEZI|nr:purine and uridine phosphorylase [Myriangium duriaei CBS 260.36]